MTTSTHLGWHFPYVRKLVSSCFGSGKLLTTLLLSFISSFVFAQTGGDVDQGANGALDAPHAVTFQNGNLHGGNSHFLEGHSIPYRLVMTNLVVDQVYVITVGFDALEKGWAAIDYITGYNNLTPHNFIPHNTPEAINPLNGLAYTDATFNNVITNAPLPAPSYSAPAATGSWLALEAAKKNITLYGGTVANAADVWYPANSFNPANIGTGVTTAVYLSVRFTAKSTTALLAWGGHISKQSDYGDNTTAVTQINGAPYHMRRGGFTNSNGSTIYSNEGADRSVSIDAILVCEVTPGVIAGSQSICTGQTLNAFTVTTAATGSGALTYRWESSTTGCEGPWTPIAGQTGPTYTPPATLGTIYYHRVAISEAACEAAGNCLIVTVRQTAAQPAVDVTAPTCTVATGQVCVTSPVDGGGVDYEYANNGGAWQDGLCFTVNAGAAYSITARIKGTTCVSVARTGTMAAQPGTAAQPAVDVTAPTCTVATGQVCVTSPVDGGGVDYEYANNGGAWQDGLCFTVNAGAAYSITARIKGTTCVSVARTGTMAAQPGTAAQPAVDVTAPTCTVATGQVCVTSPVDGGGVDYEYANNGGAWQDGLCFTVNAGAAYSITARIKGTTCVSVARTGTMAAQPGTAAQPAVDVTAPTCTVATGQVCVTSPVDGGGVDYEYANNGGAWQDGLCFTVNAGAAYSITARIKGTTCVSVARTGTMAAQPGTAAQPAVDVTAPTCTVATGQVCVTSPVDGGGVDYEYANNGGAWQDGLCFTVNAGAAYSITARIKGTTCVSVARTGTMAAQPGTAAQPAVDVTAPTCTVATGQVCVTSPVDGGGVDYEYANNGGAWQDGLCFTVNAGAAYSITARIKGTTCVSVARTGTMAAQPGTAAQPAVDVTAPTCTVATGQVCVTSPVDGGGVDYEYANNGGAWQDGLCFTVNAGAAYSITARIKGTTCVSVARTGTMAAQPGTAAQPAVDVTAPTCTVATGQVCVTSPVDGGGVDYEYANNGGAWQDGLCFTVNAGAAYSITARIKGTTCVSVARTGTMAAQPGTAAQPAVDVTAPTCTVATGQVCVTSPVDGGGVDYEYANNGGAWQDGLCFTVNAGAAYSITARIKGTTCVSVARTGTMAAQPGTAAQPAVDVTAPTCTVATGQVCVTSPVDGGGVDYEYANNGGAWQDGLCFTVNAGAAYSITARIKGTTCVSVARTGTMAGPAVCGLPICSYTQGFWGNKNGLAKMKTVFANTGDITIGHAGGFRIIIPTATDADAVALNSMMPGGSTAQALTANCIVTANFAACMTANYLTKQKKINNVLLSQTITLSLNVLNDPTLNPIPITSCIVTERGTFYIDQKIVDYLGATGKVSNLLTLANWALSGQTLPAGLTYSMINNAVDAINNAFDECQRYLGSTCPILAVARLSTNGTVDQTASLIKMNVKAFPNPYSDRVQFNIESSVSGKGSLVVYNMLGQKVKTVFEGYVFAGRGQVVDFKVPAASRANLIYVLTIGGKQTTGKLLNQRY